MWFSKKQIPELQFILSIVKLFCSLNLQSLAINPGLLTLYWLHYIFCFFVFWSKWPKMKKISCQFQAKCGFFHTKNEETWQLNFFVFVHFDQKTKNKKWNEPDIITWLNSPQNPPFLLYWTKSNLLVQCTVCQRAKSF